MDGVLYAKCGETLRHNTVQVKLADSDSSHDVRVEDNFDNKMIRKVIAS